jgi:hypothetical protein
MREILLSNKWTYERSILTYREYVVIEEKMETYAHCSMLANACSMTALFFRLPSFAGLTMFLTYNASRGGRSGGLGEFGNLCPIDFNCPVLYR